MKQAITILAGEETYANLSTFQNINELNETVRHYRQMISDSNLRNDLKRNLITLIRYLQGYSCSFFGVSWRGKRKIAADLGMSDKTITRLCQRLESLGIIRQLPMKRPSDMQQTSNAIVIQPVEIIVEKENVRQDSAEMSDQENNISLKQHPNINHSNVIVPGVPKSLQYFKNIFGDNLRMMWFRIHLAMKKLRIHIDKETRERIGRIVFDAMKSYKYLPEEQLRKLAYTIAFNQLQQRKKSGDIFDENDWFTVLALLPPKERPATNDELNALGVY